MDTAIAALAGVAMGGVFGFLGHWLNNRSAFKREMRKAAYEAAITEYRTHVELAKMPGMGGRRIFPLAHYIAFHQRLVSTRMKSKDIERVLRESHEMRGVIEDTHAQMANGIPKSRFRRK